MPLCESTTDECSACVSAAIRLERSTPLLTSNDVVYIFDSLGIWIEYEITAGFLVLGIPALPKVIKSSPGIQRYIKLIKSSRGKSMIKYKSNSRKGLPSWYKNKRCKKPNIESGWSAIDVCEKGVLVSHNLNVGCNSSKNGAPLFSQSPEKEEWVEEPSPVHMHERPSSEDEDRIDATPSPNECP